MEGRPDERRTDRARGRRAEGGDFRTAVVRLLPNAKLDRTFSKDGIRVMDPSPANDDVYGLAVTDDDEILLGVNLFANGSFDPHVVKLTRSGKCLSSCREQDVSKRRRPGGL